MNKSFSKSLAALFVSQVVLSGCLGVSDDSQTALNEPPPSPDNIVVAALNESVISQLRNIEEQSDSCKQLLREWFKLDAGNTDSIKKLIDSTAPDGFVDDKRQTLQTDFEIVQGYTSTVKDQSTRIGAEEYNTMKDLLPMIEEEWKVVKLLCESVDLFGSHISTLSSSLHSLGDCGQEAQDKLDTYKSDYRQLKSFLEPLISDDFSVFEQELEELQKSVQEKIAQIQDGAVPPISQDGAVPPISKDQRLLRWFKNTFNPSGS